MVNMNYLYISIKDNEKLFSSKARIGGILTVKNHISLKQ